jgi:hypothetical protein
MEKKELKCTICSREAHMNGYCKPHSKAHQNVIKKYEYWTIALKSSWKEYLREIVKNPLTGKWAREVAEKL